MVKKHFLQYHNTDKMGYPCQELSSGDFFILTRKKIVSGQEGNTVWLIGGEGKPRRFTLCQVFKIDRIEFAPEPDFIFKASGTDGIRFNPPIELTGIEWFEELKVSSGNFAFGFSELNKETVMRLHRLASSSKQYLDLANSLAGSLK